MKVLVIGASDTLGTYLADRSMGTFGILSRELPVLFKEPVDVSHVRFYSHFPKAPEHAVATVREREADIAIVAAHSLAFATPSLGARLIHLFGWRVGRWMERRIWDMDGRAKSGGFLGKVRGPVRAAAYKVIGTATYASVDETIERYSQTIGQLARIEDLQIVLLGTFQPRRDGELGPHLQLNAGLASIAAARRIRWIDRQEIVSGLGPDAFQESGLYSTPLTHRKVADAVIAALAR